MKIVIKNYIFVSTNINNDSKFTNQQSFLLFVNSF